MKFMLVMTICSATFQNCLPPSDVQPIYDTHYDCATAGYINALGVLQELDVNSVNTNKLVVNFKCYPQSDI